VSEWDRFTAYLIRTIGAMYDDVTPAEVVAWLFQTWEFDRARPSRDEMLGFCLEHLAAGIKRDLPTWSQLHMARMTERKPTDLERKETPRPPGAGLFHGHMDDLLADVMRNGLGVIEGGKPPPAASGTSS
jgi:hypothetical protein